MIREEIISIAPTFIAPYTVVISVKSYNIDRDSVV